VKAYVDAVAPELSEASSATTSRDDRSFERIVTYTSSCPRRSTARLWLTSGGSIIIERNRGTYRRRRQTGKNVGKSNSRDTGSSRTNLEAADEVAQPSYGAGHRRIIVIDFIRMEIRFGPP